MSKQPIKAKAKAKPPVPAKKPHGRPTKYKQEYDDMAYKMALLGITDQQMADCFGVGLATFYRWQDAHITFRESVIRGKVPADSTVAASLYHRANGYSHPEIDIKVINGEIVKTEITKHYPPDTAAAFIWLKNRQPKHWRDKMEIEGDLNVNLFPPKEVLEAVYHEGMQRAAERRAALTGRMERLGITIDADATPDSE